MCDVNFVGPLFSDQRCPFERALSPTHDQYSLSAQKFKINHIAGMRVRPGRQVVSQLGRVLLEPRKAETQYHLVCAKLRAVVERCCIDPIRSGEMCDEGGVGCQIVLSHEPARIIEKHVEW